MEIEGKHIVVTGGAGGIGRAMCRRFADAGARMVHSVDLDEAGAQLVAKEIGGRGSGLDVCDGAALEALVVEAEERDGPIDLFCSNAGILVLGIEEVDDASWQRIWEVNLMSHVRAARVLVPRMLERGGGYLLNTASAAGLLSQIGSAPYAVTKHAAVAFAESLAIAHGNQGLKVSVLCPQAVRTAMTAGTEEGGVAGVDGMLEAEEVAEIVVAGLRDEHFLILPHASVREYMKRKAADPDRWLGGMRRLQARYLAQ